MIYFYDFKKEFDDLKILEYPYDKHIKNQSTDGIYYSTPKKLSRIINNIEELTFSKIDYKSNEKIYIYYCQNLTRGLLELKYPNITESELTYLFSNYGSVDTINGSTMSFEQYLKFRQSIKTDSNLNNISLNILEYKDPNIANFNLLISRISQPKIRFFCEYVFLDEMERLKFASSKLEYIINIPRQITTDVFNDEFFSSEVDILNPTKDIFWFFKPKTQYLGLDKYGYKNPNIYNRSEYYDINIINDLKIIFQDFEIVNFEKLKSKYYDTVTKHKYLNPTLINGYYYYSFSLFPKESQPSGNVNLSSIKGKVVNARLNSLFLSKYFDLNVNRNNLTIDFIIINNYYNLVKIDKGKFTSVFY